MGEIDKGAIRSIVKQHFMCYSKNIRIRDDGTVDSTGELYLRSTCQITKIPVQFHSCRKLYIADNSLTTLDGCPKKTYAFQCAGNQLRDLMGGPESTTDYDCRENPLTSLSGLATSIDGVLRLTITDDLNLLRILGSRITGEISEKLFGPSRDARYFLLNKFRSDIMQGRTTSKVAMWKCQQELIDNGQEGNAKW
jgi:hypothetical protein